MSIKENMIREEDAKLRQDMTNEDIKLKQELKKPPPMFSCYRTDDFNSPGIVTYSNCSLDTTDGEYSGARL